jgi:hypothetical protein
MTAAIEMGYADTNLLGDWLEFVARDGWNFLYWPHWRDPQAVAAYRRWNGFGMTDVLALVHEEFAFAYRALVPDGEDFLAPEHVLYVAEGRQPVYIVRSILTLPGPVEPSAPDVVTAAPPGIAPYFARLGWQRTLRPAGERQPLPRFKLRPKPEPSRTPPFRGEGSP